MDEWIAVEVAYATVEQTYCIALQVPVGSTLKQVIERSGLLAQCPNIDLDTQKIGVFGQICSLDQMVQAGDRVEIYRPLQIDPMAARRRRAAANRRR